MTGCPGALLFLSLQLIQDIHCSETFNGLPSADAGGVNNYFSDAHLVP